MFFNRRLVPNVADHVQHLCFLITVCGQVDQVHNIVPWKGFSK